MGAESSFENSSSLNFLSSLLAQSHRREYQYWADLFKDVPDRNKIDVPDYRFLEEIALRYPKNFESFVLMALKKLDEIDKSNEQLSDEDLNTLRLAIRVLPTAILLLLHNEKLFKILARLDYEICDELVKRKPSLASLKPKKRRKWNKTPNSLKKDQNNQENVIENQQISENQNQISKNDQKTTENEPNKGGNDSSKIENDPNKGVDHPVNVIEKEEEEEEEENHEIEDNSQKQNELNQKIGESKQISEKGAESVEIENGNMNETNINENGKTDTKPNEQINIHKNEKEKETNGNEKETNGNEKETNGNEKETNGNEKETNGNEKETNGNEKETNGNEKETNGKNIQPKNKKDKNNKNERKPMKPGAYFRSLRPFRGCFITSYTRIITSLLFKPGLTISGRKKAQKMWVHTSHIADFTRNDIVRAILVLLSPQNCSKVGSSISRILFTSTSFSLTSDNSALNDSVENSNNIPEICTSFIGSVVNIFQTCTMRLKCSCLALYATLFLKSEFRDAMDAYDPSKLVSPMFRGSVFAFNPKSPISNLEISYIFMIMIGNKRVLPELTNNSLYVKLIIEYLLNLSQQKLETEGVSYIHSIILTTLLLILQSLNDFRFLNTEHDIEIDEENDISNYGVNDEVKPCFADFIINALLDFCNRDSFLPSFICVLHLLAPAIKKLTLTTASRIFDLFEKSQNDVRKLLIDIFATVVQLPRKHSSLKAFIILKCAYFKVENAIETEKEQILIINKFLLVARKRLMKRFEQTKLDVQSIEQVMRTMKLKKHFPQPKSFLKKPKATGVEITRTWKEWAGLLVQMASPEEFKTLKKITAKS
ncbi:hypothetical protein TRFO_11494 [Tritrichomonas foetus]|uniref:Uncharacterized protein n=1 Tax=Tritrichomonas foetus TaxID=1144522 RepID=A0A1J4J3J8_9EUKA|nr:hypothetical protein TRFO_11494 [Tritrichomonas foetus]|eukprot:OHS93998.1 hypothetical protein TRFO_11494 [Tritrichomonas foetus]